MSTSKFLKKLFFDSTSPVAASGSFLKKWKVINYFGLVRKVIFIIFLLRNQMNPFHSICLFLHPLFRGYIKKPVTRNGLNRILI